MKPHRLVLIMAGIALTVLWLWQLHPYLNVANDAGRYMILGKSLATTGDLRLINEPLQPRDTLYPPGFPLLIALCLKLTGRDPGGIVLLVKTLQLIFLLVSLPLLARLLEKANCKPVTVYAGVWIAALCPTYASYANEIMSEALFLLLCLVSIVLVERDTTAKEEPDGDGKSVSAVKPAVWKRLLALLFAACAFFVRSAGISLLFVQTLWFFRRFGARWGIAALLTMLACYGGWQQRNKDVVRNALPGVHYSSYREQFTLRDPMRQEAGRIELNFAGLAERAQTGFPVYAGMMPRTLLHSMSRFSSWFGVFYFLAIPLGLLMFAGIPLVWKRGLSLSAGFGTVFWLFAAMWPWRDPRFLVPILPFLIVFAVVALETLWLRVPSDGGKKALTGIYGVMGAVLVAYFLQVHHTIVKAQNRPTPAGYTFGRSLEEAGFYAACAWLKQNAPADARLMGRPAYIVSLYTSRTAIQLEPHVNPKVQEKAYIGKNRINYIVADKWTWARTEKYLTPYLEMFGADWRVAWEDEKSGVKVWERVTMPAPKK
jgi:hypothetical protein